MSRPRGDRPTPDALAKAARALRAQVPPRPPGLDERVLAATAAPAPRARRTGGRARPLAALALVVTTAAAAVLLLALNGRPGLRPTVAQAVPIVPLTADCEGAAAGRPDRLVVAGVWAGQEARSFARVLRGFERRTGIRVTFAYETRDIAATLRARLQRGCAPDVALLPQPGMLADLARRGQIHPLTAAARRASAAHYAAPWRRLAAVDGRLYGVWFKAADKSTVWYRRDLLRAAGISAPPRTWTELLAVARRLRERGMQPFALGGAGAWTLTDWFENLYLRSAGPVPYERLAEHRLAWTDPSVVRVLRQLAELFGDPSLVGSARDALDTSFEGSVDRVFGARPSAAMVYEGDFVRSFLPAAARARARFFPFPTVDGGRPGTAVVGGDVAVAFARSRAAQRLLRYLATPAAALPWVRRGGFVSPNRDVPLSAYPDRLGREVAVALRSATTVRFDLSDLQPPAFGATAGQGMWAIFQDFLADPRDPAGTARRLDRAARAAWACERAIGGRC